jgi:hypothetical protein
MYNFLLTASFFVRLKNQACTHRGSLKINYVFRGYYLSLPHFKERRVEAGGLAPHNRNQRNCNFLNSILFPQSPFLNPLYQTTFTCYCL